MRISVAPKGRRQNISAFTLADFLIVIAALMLLTALVVPFLVKSRSTKRQMQCTSNLHAVSAAILAYEASYGRLPDHEPGMKGGVWWWYKEQVKSELGLRGPSSPADKVFACPDDRGYEEGKPFRLSAKFDYGSYTFNGVNLPGVPNVAGKALSAIRDPTATLLVMEWSAHAPLSWHRSRTGKKNHPFYNNAESVVGFADGRVEFIKIYYDGLNAAYTRDPIPGYKYKYSGD